MSKNLLRALITLFIAGLLITACATPATPAPQEPAATEAPAPTEAPAATEAPAPTEAPVATEAPAQPEEAGTCIRIAGVEVSGEKLNLDPINQPSTENSIMVEQVYNRLLDMDSDFVVHPELAESWEPNEDATE
ncbi:MAG: hypothetical protein ACWGO1_10150, partial [Anaerolineales bacterium]